jgi:hypothetical protein
MATTTNYGWTTPDDTALVKDGAAAIRTLGSSVDTTTKALNPSTTLGDIEYRSSTANTNTRLGIGSTGQILTVAGGVPSWATPAGGGGKVLQVVQGTTTTAATLATTSQTDTNITATITPTSATSTILIMASSNVQIYRENAGGGNEQALRYTLLRGASVISGSSTNNAARMTVATSTDAIDVINFFTTTFKDSPATTSATTYKIQAAASSTNQNGKVTFQTNSGLGQITLLEIGA